MKYTVLDLKTLSVDLADRAAAEATLAQLQLDNPDADWQMFMSVAPMDDNAMEALYALASLMLTTAKVDPIKTALQISKFDGTIEDRSLLTIMREARTYIDQQYANQLGLTVITGGKN